MRVGWEEGNAIGQARQTKLDGGGGDADVVDDCQ